MRYALTLAAAVAAAPASAQVFECTVDSSASSIDASIEVGITSTGSLIGDYDATDNPGGTQTRLGLFGGSGNNPIPMSLDATATSDFALSPAGAFGLTLDTSGMSFFVEDLATDLLNGQTVDADLNATIEYDSFNTINPSSFYPGGIPITIPLEAATLTALDLVQTGAMTDGVLTPVDADTYAYAGTLPAAIVVEGSFLGQAFPGEPIPVTLPVGGTVDFNLDGTVTTSVSIDISEISQSVDVSAIPPIEDIPFSLPTLTGGTANVLLTLQLSDLSLASDGSLTLVATGVQAGGCNPADIALPYGDLNIDDVLAFLNAFAAGEIAADIAAPTGTFNIDDVLSFLNLFANGCP